MRKSLFPTSNILNNPNKTGFLLLFLAIADSFFTDIGIRHHFISEANPLMRFVYDSNIASFYVIKLSLPFLLLILLRKIEPKPVFHFLIGAALFLYLFVFIQHLLWITIVLNVSN